MFIEDILLDEEPPRENQVCFLCKQHSYRLIYHPFQRWEKVPVKKKDEQGNETEETEIKKTDVHAFFCPDCEKIINMRLSNKILASWYDSFLLLLKLFFKVFLNDNETQKEPEGIFS